MGKYMVIHPLSFQLFTFQHNRNKDLLVNHNKNIKLINLSIQFNKLGIIFQ